MQASNKKQSRFLYTHFFNLRGLRLIILINVFKRSEKTLILHYIYFDTKLKSGTWMWV